MPQFPQPYPGTPMRQEMIDAGLVVNIDDWTTYNGSICQCNTLSGLTPSEIEAIVLREQMELSRHSVKSILSSTFMRRNPKHVIKWLTKEGHAFMFDYVKNLGKTWEERAGAARKQRIAVNQFNL